MDRSNYLTYSNYQEYREQLNIEHKTFNEDHVGKCLDDIGIILNKEKEDK